MSAAAVFVWHGYLGDDGASGGKQLLRSRRLPPASGQAVWSKNVDITLDELARLANMLCKGNTSKNALIALIEVWGMLARLHLTLVHHRSGSMGVRREGQGGRSTPPFCYKDPRLFRVFKAKIPHFLDP